MKSFTVQDMMNLVPCYGRSKVEALWDGRQSLTLHEILDLDMLAVDRIWAWCRLVSAKQARLFACDCAESVLSIFEDAYPNDDRPRKAVEVARLYTEGKATEEELRKARSNVVYAAVTAYAAVAARAAARAAVAATRTAAYAYDAVAYAARAAYAKSSDAESLAIAAAAVDEERQKQIEFARRRS